MVVGGRDPHRVVGRRGATGRHAMCRARATRRRRRWQRRPGRPRGVRHPGRRCRSVAGRRRRPGVGRRAGDVDLCGGGAPDHRVAVGRRAARASQCPSPDSIDAAFDLAASLVGSTSTHDRSSFELRSLRTGGEMWEPAVILLHDADRASAELAAGQQPRPGHGIGLVAAVGPADLRDAPARLVGETDRWNLVAAGRTISMTPIGLDRADIDAVVAILHDAEQPLIWRDDRSTSFPLPEPPSMPLRTWLGPKIVTGRPFRSSRWITRSSCSCSAGSASPTGTEPRAGSSARRRSSWWRGWRRIVRTRLATPPVRRSGSWTCATPRSPTWCRRPAAPSAGWCRHRPARSGWRAPSRSSCPCTGGSSPTRS